MKFMDKITPRFILEAKDTFKASGFKGVVKKYGWKFFAFFFAYYLIRDVCLYIILPWYIARSVL
ncbi:hypothetical protein D3C87_1953960 [compost metagenome]